MKQTTISIPADAVNSTPLISADFTLSYLGIVNTGTGIAYLGFDTPAIVGQGLPLMPGAQQGTQGGGFQMDRQQFPRFASVVHAISAAGTTLVMLVE